MAGEFRVWTQKEREEEEKTRSTVVFFICHVLNPRQCVSKIRKISTWVQHFPWVNLQ